MAYAEKVDLMFSDIKQFNYEPDYDNWKARNAPQD
jgi:hypothetical protein